jgi:hypothetical protein
VQFDIISRVSAENTPGVAEVVVEIEIYRHLRRLI